MHTASTMKNLDSQSLFSTKPKSPWMVSSHSRWVGIVQLASTITAVITISVTTSQSRYCSFFCRNTKIPPISGTRIGSSNSMGALPHKQQVSNQPDTRLDQVCDRVVKNAQHKNSHDQDGGSRGEGPVRSQIPRMHVG